MPRPPRRLPWLFATAVLALAGCQRSHEPAAAAGDAPAAAVRQLIDDLRHDDLGAFWKHGLPPADYAALAARWRRGRDAVPSDRARAGYRQFMAGLTAPGAETVLADRLQAQARRIDDRYGDQVPVLVAIGGAMVRRRVAADLALNPRQEQGLQDVLAPLAAAAPHAPWLDGRHVRQAAAIAVDTARSLRLPTLDQVRALDVPAAMAEASRLWTGARRVLALYGLPLDGALDSAKVAALPPQGAVAHVRVDYRWQGRPQQLVLKLHRTGGAWYPDVLARAAGRLGPPDWERWWGPSGAAEGPTAAGGDAGASPLH